MATGAALSPGAKRISVRCGELECDVPARHRAPVHRVTVTGATPPASDTAMSRVEKRKLRKPGAIASVSGAPRTG